LANSSNNANLRKSLRVVRLILVDFDLLFVCSWTRKLTARQQKEKEVKEGKSKEQTAAEMARIAQNANRTAAAANKRLANVTDEDLKAAGFSRAFAERVRSCPCECGVW
jgi:hypothetical protein